MSNRNVSLSRATIKTYKIILHSFMHGYLRLLEAQNCTLKLTNALLKFRQKPRGPFEGSEYEEVLTAIRSVSRSSFIAVEYVTAVSNLVYATSLFDTFLTDTVTFLFLLIPESMGKDLQIPLQTLLSSKSRNAVLQQVVTNKARELSFRTFRDRLQFFRGRFGMPVTISESDMEKLVHFTNIRNSAVHDQGILELKLSQSGAIASGLRNCPIHPTRLSDRDADDAAKLYYRIVERIGFDVLTHVLKVKKSGLPPNLKPYCKEISARARKNRVSDE
ncbi:MAG: hypothetical protein ACLGPM_09000 [Acidobacteriota bacterium]